jgi:hypothetical protein
LVVVGELRLVLGRGLLLQGKAKSKRVTGGCDITTTDRDVYMSGQYFTISALTTEESISKKVDEYMNSMRIWTVIGYPTHKMTH